MLLILPQLFEDWLDWKMLNLFPDSFLQLWLYTKNVYIRHIIPIFSRKCSKVLLARRWEAARVIWAARSRSFLALRVCCFHWRNCWNFKEYWQKSRAFLRSSTSLFFSLRTSCLSLRYWHHLKKYLVLTWTSSLISISPSSYRICSSSPTSGSTFCSC